VAFVLCYRLPCFVLVHPEAVYFDQCSLAQLEKLCEHIYSHQQQLAHREIARALL
jgi:hypothetical protein